MKDNFTNGKSEGKIVTVPLLMTKMSLNSKQMGNGCEGHFQKWNKERPLKQGKYPKKTGVKGGKITQQTDFRSFNALKTL